MVQFASYLRRVLHKTRLIFSCINGPIVLLHLFLRAVNSTGKERVSPKLLAASILFNGFYLLDDVEVFIRNKTGHFYNVTFFNIQTLSI